MLLILRSPLVLESWMSPMLCKAVFPVCYLVTLILCLGF